MIKYVYEVIDLDKDENHQVLYRFVSTKKLNLTIRNDIEQ